MQTDAKLEMEHTHLPHVEQAGMTGPDTALASLRKTPVYTSHKQERYARPTR